MSLSRQVRRRSIIKRLKAENALFRAMDRTDRHARAFIELGRQMGIDEANKAKEVKSEATA